MKISVIIPCYNEETYIGQALGSIVEQSYQPAEIIVVDDGSDDKSANIARSFGEIVTVLSSGGKGAPKARNLGAEYASGDALMFFDADDVLGPEALESLAACLEQHSNGVVTCPWYRLQKIDDKWVQRPRSCKPLGAGEDKLSGWLTGWWHPPCSVLWSRAAYDRAGGWDPDVSVNQDGDLMMRALVDGIELHVTSNGAAYYRRLPEEHLPNSLSRGRLTHKGRKSQIFVLKKITQRLVERGLLNKYRKPLTIAFSKIRRLCKDQYPDLAKECLELIEEYGEPRHIRFARNVSSKSRRAANWSLSRTAQMLTLFNLTRTRQILAQIKNKLLASKVDVENKIPSGTNQHKEKEVRFGLKAYRQVSAK